MLAYPGCPGKEACFDIFGWVTGRHPAFIKGGVVRRTRPVKLKLKVVVVMMDADLVDPLTVSEHILA